MNELNKTLCEAETIMIAGHVRPDGDCIGACVALQRYIKRNYPKKEVFVYIETVPEVFEFLDENKDKNFGFTFSSNNTKSIIEGLKNEKYDLGFCSKVENETSIDFIKVKQEELVIVVPKNHELSKYNEIDLIETISYNHIVFTKSSGLRQVIDNLFKQIDCIEFH